MKQYSIEEFKNNDIAMRVNSQEDVDSWVELFETQKYNCTYEEMWYQYNQVCLSYNSKTKPGYAPEDFYITQDYTIINMNQIKGEKDMSNTLEVKVEIKVSENKPVGKTNYIVYINGEELERFTLTEHHSSILLPLSKVTRAMFKFKSDKDISEYENILDKYLVDEKFYWVVASESFQNSGLGFLNVLRNEEWRLCSKSESRDCKTQFTIGEYEALQDKLGFPKDLFKKEVITND